MSNSTSKKLLKYLLYVVLWPFSLSLLIWRWKKVNQAVKVVMICILWLGIFTLAALSEKPSTVAENSRPPVQQAVPMTREEEIESSVRKSLSQKTNNSQDKVRKVSVTKAAESENEYIVFVEINADSNLNERLTQIGVYEDNTDVYSALYKQDSGVREASIAVYANTVDKYGNTQNSVIMKTSLDKVEAEKVNWDLDKASLASMVLPAVWEKGTNIFE